MDWFTHTLSALAGFAASGIPLLLWAWGKKNSIQSQRERDDYQMEQIRKSDAYKELKSAIDESRADRVAMNDRIAELVKENIECHKNHSKLEIENYKQADVIRYLENRVKTLEAIVSPAAPPIPSQGAALASAVKEVAKEAIAEEKHDH